MNAEQAKNKAIEVNWPDIKVEYQHIINSIEAAARKGRFYNYFAITVGDKGAAIVKHLEKEGYKHTFSTHNHYLRFKYPKDETVCFCDGKYGEATNEKNEVVCKECLCKIEEPDPDKYYIVVSW